MRVPMLTPVHWWMHEQWAREHHSRKLERGMEEGALV